MAVKQRLVAAVKKWDPAGVYLFTKNTDALDMAIRIRLEVTETTIAPHELASLQIHDDLHHGRPPTHRAHQIAKRDTLWAVAKSQLGDPNRWKGILNESQAPFTQAEVTRIRIGAKVLIPLR